MAYVDDGDILRALAEQYKGLCDGEANQGRIKLWRSLNSLQSKRPMVFCNTGLLGGEIEPHLPACRSVDPQFQWVEKWFYRQFWLAGLGDDSVFYPWFPVRARMFTHPEGVWGIKSNRVRDEQSRGWRHMPVLKRMEDLDMLKATEHRVLDANPPLAGTLRKIFGDIIPVHIQRSTIYPMWGGSDLSEAAGTLFGIEELLYLLVDEPEMIHRFMTFTRDAVMANLKQGEGAGDWSTADSWYYKTPAYCSDFPDPVPGSYGAHLKELAWFFHAQEFDGVSPDMFREFLFNYQLPIMRLFGRVTYGCCETLDGKLDAMEEIPNLTKIVSGPRSDPANYPARFGDRCVISWRPIASPIAQPLFDEAAQRRQLREGLEKLRGCHVEVHMHEPMTVHGDLTRISRWAEIAIEEAERVAS